MTTPHFDGPSFDLGIFEDSQPPEDLSLLIVEDSLELDGEANHVEDKQPPHDPLHLIVEDLLEREKNINHVKDDEITSTKVPHETEALVIFRHHFDLNKVPDEL